MNGKDIQLKLNIEKEGDSINLGVFEDGGNGGFWW